MQAATPRAGRVFYQLAAEHGGYFTTAEASRAGISHRQLSYYAASGVLERVGPRPAGVVRALRALSAVGEKALDRVSGAYQVAGQRREGLTDAA